MFLSEVCDCVFRVPALMVSGQKDQLILGTNVIKHLLRHFKQSHQSWHIVRKPEFTKPPEIMQFFMLCGINRWRDDTIPDIIGATRLNQTVTVLTKQEHLV